MCAYFGRLIQQNPNGPAQEFTLAKSNVFLGRAATNDIIFNDGRVSHRHARLECSADGVVVVDLASYNGTRVNGLRIERATLKPGDTISLGGQQLKYQVDEPSEDVGITEIDSQAQLDQSMVEEFLPMVVNETSSPCLVVFTENKTWQVDLAHLERASIGRDESCNIFLDSKNISRRHAEVRREREAFILKDLESTNGTWLKGSKVSEYILEDGDSFRVGSAQLVFKSGFQEQALTMADEQLALPAGRRTVVFVPGLMGSEFWLGSERVWPSVKTIFTNPEIFNYPSNLPLEPRGIVDEIVIIPNLIKQDQYNRLGDYLVDELNYCRGVDFFEFPYDWRQDVRTSAHQLGQLVENIPHNQPVIIIAHSLGTLVTRYYIDHLGGKRRIERVILMGGPHKGAVKGLVSMLVAPEVLPFGIYGERLRQVVLTFPSSYQILPDYPVGTDQDGKKIDFFEEETWIPPQYNHLLKMGCEFRKELGYSTSVPTTSIFGYGLKTISEVSVVRDFQGKYKNITYLRKDIGDGSVLEQSAFLPGSDIHPVHQHHGALFVDNDVKMRLKLELTRAF